MKTIHKEPHWPASLALLACAGLFIALPSRVAIGPKWLLPLLVVLPLIPLSARRHRHPDDAPWVRNLCVSLIALVTVANMTSVGLLVDRLLNAHVSQGRQLIFSAVSIWITNVIVFGLWFWEMDRGGPHLRAGSDALLPDIQFPQMENPTLAPSNWRPQFFDYLYTSFANGTSFAPADAMPLSSRAKALFLGESIASLVTISIVAARAVNILH
ncbi:MAG TPA: hypothetical protein VGZ04_00175 [Acidimicrobiales bacterium]|nr:hypothetical protein [Acidimicrobiales bacterium]